MKIQVNTDKNIHGDEALVARVTAMIERELQHFRDYITRVEAHLSDENADKKGPQDHRCVLEARLEGRQPVAATDQGATPDHAVLGAAGKLARLVGNTLERAQQRRPQ